MKHYTEKTAAAVRNKVLTNARKGMLRVYLHEAWTDKNGRCCVSDGFRAYRLKACPNGLSVTYTVHAGNNTEYGIPLDRFYHPLTNGNVVEMQAPNETEVMDFIKANTTLRKTRSVFNNRSYDLGEGFPMVNAKYLLDMIRLFPEAKWYVYSDPYERMAKPVFAVCAEGDGFIMPIRDDSKPWNRPENEQNK